jgi:hypothetical protein
MKTELITQTLVHRLQTNGLQINQVSQSEKDGNVEITIHAHELGLKSLTIKMEEHKGYRPLSEDFNLIGEDEGFTDYVDYVTDSPGELVLAADEDI